MITTFFTAVRIYNDQYSSSHPIQVDILILFLILLPGKLTRLAIIAIQVVCQSIKYNVAARKITWLGLYACIVLYYVTGRVWGTINMSTLQCTIVQQYIANRLGSKEDISCSKTTIHSPFKLKTSAPVRTCIGKHD